MFATTEKGETYMYTYVHEERENQALLAREQDTTHVDIG
jgi:hypothetical protein